MKTKNNVSFTIMKRELSAYFTAPAAYITGGLFLILTGLIFFSTFFIIKRSELRPFFNLLPYVLSIFVPALTMRIFAEEKKSGSFETLMTMPVTEFQVVAGKYLAALISAAVMVAPTVFYAVTVRIFGEIDYGPVIGGYTGTVFLCAAYSAIGVYCSACTKNQILAFFESLAISILLTAAGKYVLFLPAGIVKFISFISIGTHFDAIAKGIVDSRDIIYFASLISIFIMLTVRKLQNEKN